MSGNKTSQYSRVYCTYFDSGYLSRGLALIASLREHGDESKIVILALDEKVSQFFAQVPHPNVIVIELQKLEEHEPRLLEVKESRTKMEYYFTCTPILIDFVMTVFTAKDEYVVYLDADLYFFDSPDEIFTDLDNGSIGIIEHKYSPRLDIKLQVYGRFNVGLLIFKHDQHGISLLKWYLNSCIDWCGDAPSDGRYADQGYLNQFPNWKGCEILESPGFNLAPWNDANFILTKQDNGKVIVNNDSLVFFHFHGLKKFKNRYITSELVYGSRISKILRNEIYIPYINELEKQDGLVKTVVINHTVIQNRGNGYKKYLFRMYKFFLSIFIVISGNSIKSE